MKIDKVQINAFGKLQDKFIDFEDGINIVLGENESGKSSTLKFIASMFYGASKNKNGKEISDFDKFKPWQAEDFSGKISYSLDNGEYYEVYREFKKKNPVIYNKAKEDISKTFVMDKTKGIDFFTEQTGIDEETFYNTAINEQEGLKLSKSGQTTIIQKISNLVSSGDDSISYKKSLEKITRRQNEEIGTDRTFQRPINIINNKIKKLLDEKNKLETYKEKIFDNTSQKEQLLFEKQNEERKIEFLKELKNKLDNNRVKNAEVNFSKNLEAEYEEKIRELNSKLENDGVEKQYEEIHLKNYIISLIVFAIIFGCLLVFSSIKLVSLVTVIPAIAILIKLFLDKKKVHNSKRIREESMAKIINEIDVLKENKERKSAEALEKEEKLLEETERENKNLSEKYSYLLDTAFMQDSFKKSYDEILRELDTREKRINTINFNLQTMDNTEKEINNKLDSLAKMEEELEDSELERDELLSLNKSYNIAKECIEKAYKGVKENISPKFTKNLCKIISKISDNRYKNIVLSDDDGLKVEVENGSYVPVSRLSVGTIDQMYLSLRLSAISEITKETMPIILDEAFAYFDDERLRNIFKYLNQNYSKYQIIILTCSKREMNILDGLKIKYNVVNF